MAKQFSNAEKALIMSIYNAKGSNTYVLTNVFKRWLDMHGIRFDLGKGDLVFELETYKDSDTILSIKKEIISVALLIKYLEDEGYIYIIKDETSSGQPEYVGAQEIKTPIHVALPQEIGFIIRRSLYNIYVSYDLISFVENGFRTYEDMQLSQAAVTLDTSRNQLKISRWSLIVSASALAFSLVFYQYSNCTQNKQNQTMLEALTKFETNFCAINNKNAIELGAHIDSLGISLSQKNTNNVSATKSHQKRVTVKKQYNLIQIDTISCDGKQYLVLPIKK